MSAAGGGRGPPDERAAFLADVIAGLAARPRRLPGKYLWDEAGSHLFDRICGHPDYYPTRCEMALLPRVAREIADRVGPGATVVEFGSGASRKIRALLDALSAPARYVAVDISRDYLNGALARLAPDYPDVEMLPVCADYSRPVALPPPRAGSSVLGFFPGTSVGNLAPDEAGALLARARESLGPSRFLIGADATRDEARLLRVYGGCGGLMAALHLNLLARLNRELGAAIAPGAFRHEVCVRQDPFRVEAHLVASRATTWRLGGRAIAFEAGESVRTDTSHKFAPGAFQTLVARAGWVTEQAWSEGGYGLHLLAA